MEYRRLGASGLSVPVLSLGTGTFGGKGEFFAAWGSTDATEARRLVDICLDAGVNMFDTADIYSDGEAETILGEAIKGRRDKVLISTKATFRFGDGPNDVGSSRFHLLAAVDAALKRLRHRLHRSLPAARLRRHDAVEEVLVDARRSRARRQDPLRRRARISPAGTSMKSLGVADKYGYPRYVAQPGLLLADRPRLRMGADAARPRSEGSARWCGARSAGAGSPARSAAASRCPKTSRLHESRRYRARRSPTSIFTGSSMRSTRSRKETGKTVPQIALNWLLQRPTVSTVIIGARNEEQLRQNLGAVGWNLTAEQVAKLDAASDAAARLSVLAPARTSPSATRRRYEPRPIVLTRP